MAMEDMGTPSPGRDGPTRQHEPDHAHFYKGKIGRLFQSPPPRGKPGKGGIGHPVCPIEAEDRAGCRQSQRQDAMNPLANSSPFRVFLVDEGVSSGYLVSISAPYSDLMSPPVLIPERMKGDGLSLAGIVSALRRWCEVQPDVERVVLSHTAGRYVIGILLAGLPQGRVGEVEAALGEVRDHFAGHRLSTYVLGPNQRTLSVFTEAGSLVVYHGPYGDAQTATG